MYFLNISCGIWPGLVSFRVCPFSVVLERGCEDPWDETTNLAKSSSVSGLTVSRTTHKTSNRDRIGSVSSTFWAKGIVELYRPPIGFAAAMMEHRACNVVIIPAFEIDMDCCSMAS